MPRQQLDTPQSCNSVDYKKVLEKIQSKDLREQVREIARNNSREAYLERLKSCGVIFK